MRSFSALQRAENSSMPTQAEHAAVRKKFQCSSASRKFLNVNPVKCVTQNATVSVLFSEPKIPQFQHALSRSLSSKCFSALQRAENSSIESSITTANRAVSVSVLFSEPKIPQCTCAHFLDSRVSPVSVLFSEPKIPQSSRSWAGGWCSRSFQCSSASRKFLNQAVNHRKSFYHK